MAEKYHIETTPVPPRLPRIGKYGVIDWREDCSRCHNCVKKLCVYDRHRQEMDYIRTLSDMDALFFDCMGCFSCVQDCTKNLLGMTVNPEFERLGDDYWHSDIIRTTWLQAETGKIPVSGAGYGGTFSGPGFDSMWTDMSEIVRPTRDGIHGREYISTTVEIGRKPSYLVFTGGELTGERTTQVSLPLPVVLDILPDDYGIPALDSMRVAAAHRTGTLALLPAATAVDYADDTTLLPHIAPVCEAGGCDIPDSMLSGVRLVEIIDGPNIMASVGAIKERSPDTVVMVRVPFDGGARERAVALTREGVEAIHLEADRFGAVGNGGAPVFIKDALRDVHGGLVEAGLRDEVTIIAGGGIALAEHMAKSIICGADAVTVGLPLLIGLECRLCAVCEPEISCPAKISEITDEYGVGRMTNLIGAWHNQLIELLGAMGIREVRRLRGETGRAMFFEELEEESFGRLFGQRTDA